MIPSRDRAFAQLRSHDGEVQGDQEAVHSEFMYFKPVVRQNVFIAEPVLRSAPRWLLRDRDSIYDDQVRRRIASLGITEVVSSPLSPWQNPTWSA